MGGGQVVLRELLKGRQLRRPPTAENGAALPELPVE